MDSSGLENPPGKPMCGDDRLQVNFNSRITAGRAARIVPCWGRRRCGPRGSWLKISEARCVGKYQFCDAFCQMRVITQCTPPRAASGGDFRLHQTTCFDVNLRKAFMNKQPGTLACWLFGAATSLGGGLVLAQQQTTGAPGSPKRDHDGQQQTAAGARSGSSAASSRMAPCSPRPGGPRGWSHP